jgi:cell division protein FtsI (penicillin-binding protein 3)
VADQKADRWRATVRKRVLVLAAVFAVWVAAIEARLVFLQLFQRAEYQTAADKAHKQRVEVPARRGEILDRNGRVLAFSVDADTIYAVPSAIRGIAGTVDAVCGALGDCTPREREILAERLGRKSLFAYVRRQVTAAEKDRVKERIDRLKLPGIYFRTDPQRAYPNGNLAAHLLGFVGTDERGETDSKGLAGIESTYDARIAGTPGEMLVQVDARNNVFSRIGTPPANGQTLELTIDGVLQYIAERELEAGVTGNRAAGGCVIIMDPATAEILALASAPSFDPNAFGESEAKDRRNRCVQDLYEPGSTFKVVTASAALEEGVVRPSDLIDVSAGKIQIGSSRIVEDAHRSGVLSFTDVIVKSSNVGAIKVGFRLGAERLGRYVHRFGFGTRLSPDFPGENPGIVWSPSAWTDGALASVSMGYQVGVTPLQMATAVSAVANGGALLQPRVVRALIKDNVRMGVPHRRIGVAIAPNTAAELTTMMEGVVERGTATAAKLPGFTVAGKTGTAAKLVNGVYSRTDYNSSFVGFVPSRTPLVTILVMIDTPRAGPIYGGAVAAPIFKRIADQALQRLGASPSINPPPALLVAYRQDMPEVRTAGPAASATGPAVPVGTAEDGSGMPDLRGLGLRQAIRALARFGVIPRASGAGVVIAQDPSPGTSLEPGATCRLVLGRLLAPPPASGQRP